MSGSAPAAWGPQARRASLCITLDNLGEASALERGLHPPDAPIGRHYTATTFLPALLDTLGERRVTYFIEASNCALYPDALRSLHEAGHEIGLHGWRHERWHAQAPSRRQQLLADSMRAMRALDIEPAGFRPPGGALPPGGLGELKAAGLDYCSPLADPHHLPHVEADGLAVLPFSWTHVDAFVLDPDLGVLRESFGWPPEPSSPKAWVQSLDTLLDDLQTQGGHATVIFHPYLLGRDRQMLAVFRHFLREVDACPDLWTPTCRELAASLARPPFAGPV